SRSASPAMPSTSCGCRATSRWTSSIARSMERSAMPEGQVIPEGQLEAASPYELRVDGAKNVPEVDVRAALASGDMGFLHSFTTGSAVDGPGIRVVAWTGGG